MDCLVKGCTNKSHQGHFVGDLCAPCHHYITTGNVGPTDSFLGEMRQRIQYLEDLMDRLAMATNSLRGLSRFKP